MFQHVMLGPENLTVYPEHLALRGSLGKQLFSNLLDSHVNMNILNLSLLLLLLNPETVTLQLMGPSHRLVNHCGPVEGGDDDPSVCGEHVHACVHADGGSTLALILNDINL